MKKKICIEGLMGSGKSSLIKGLSCAKKFSTFEEQVMFDGKVDNGFLTQMKFLSSRHKQWNSKDLGSLNFFDRSVWSDIVFAMVSESYGYMSDSEYLLYKDGREILLNQCSKPDLVFYLEVHPEQCMTRIKERGDVDSGTGYGFLLRQKISYEMWMEDMERRGVEVITLDGTEEKQDILKDVIEITLDYFK